MSSSIGTFVASITKPYSPRELVREVIATRTPWLDRVDLAKYGKYIDLHPSTKELFSAYYRTSNDDETARAFSNSDGESRMEEMILVYNDGLKYPPILRNIIRQYGYNPDASINYPATAHAILLNAIEFPETCLSEACT